MHTVKGCAKAGMGQVEYFEHTQLVITSTNTNVHRPTYMHSKI